MLVGPTHEGVEGARLLRALLGLNDSNGSPKASAMVFGAATEPPPVLQKRRTRLSQELNTGTTFESQSKSEWRRIEQLNKASGGGEPAFFKLANFYRKGSFLATSRTFFLIQFRWL